MMVGNDDDSPQLSAETLKALQEWRQEQEENKAANVPVEDWVRQYLTNTLCLIFRVFTSSEIRQLDKRSLCCLFASVK